MTTSGSQSNQRWCSAQRAASVSSLGSYALETGPAVAQGLAELAKHDRHCEVVTHAVAVAQPDHRQHRRAATEHVHVVSEAVDERSQTSPQRLGAGHLGVVPTALDRGQIEEVELHHLESPGAHPGPELAQPRAHLGVRRIEAPTAVTVCEWPAVVAADHPPTMITGHTWRAGLHHEGRQPQARPAAERTHLAGEFRKVARETVVGPPRAVGHLPPVVQLDQIESRSRVESLAEQASVSDELLPVDEQAVVVPGLPSRDGPTCPPPRPAHRAGQRRQVLDRGERVAPGGERDRGTALDDTLGHGEPEPGGGSTS